MLGCRQRAHLALAAFAALATRRELTLKRAKTGETRWTEGVDFRGFQCGKRQSPTSGKNPLSLFPAKSAQPKMRNQRKYLTARRAPSSPQACVEKGNPRVTGWANYFRHAKASQAFRGVQRFVHIRFRRYWTQSSTGRGCGWQR